MDNNIISILFFIDNILLNTNTDTSAKLGPGGHPENRSEQKKSLKKKLKNWAFSINNDNDNQHLKIFKK